MLRSWLVLVLSACSSACGSAPVPMGDAGTPDAGTSLAAPALPILTPCPEGWREGTGADGVATCEPAASVSCAPGMVRYAGRAGCEAVGSACPSGVWPADLPAATRYVRAGSSGDGSRNFPFGSIAAALAGASAGTTIAIGPGSYDEALVIPDGVELRGNCVTQVTLTRTDAGEEAVVRNAGGTSGTLRDLSVRSDGHAGVFAYGTITLRGVVVDAASVAVGGIGGTIDARELHVLHARTTSDGHLGRLVAVEAGGHATLRRSVLEDGGDGGATAAGAGSSLDLDEVAIRGTRGNALGRFGSGVGVLEGASAIVHRSEIVGAHEAGVLVSGGSLELEDSVVRGARSEATQGNGYGVFVREATASLARVWVDDCQRAGVAAFGGSTLSASDVLVTRSMPNEFERLGVGIGIVDSGATLARALVADSVQYGVLVAGDGAPVHVEASDLTILRTAEGTDTGVGLAVLAMATMRLDRLRLEDARVLGVNVGGAGSSLALSDADVSAIEGTARFDFGRAIEVDVGAHAIVTRARLSETRESSAVAYESGSLLELADVEVDGIRERACAASTCASEPGGIGVAALAGGRVRGERVRVAGAPLCGVQVAVDGQMDLEAGSIDGCAIGACVQVEGFDVTRLTSSVAYSNNDVDVDLATHQVPEPAGSAPAF